MDPGEVVVIMHDASWCTSGGFHDEVERQQLDDGDCTATFLIYLEKQKHGPTCNQKGDRLQCSVVCD